jgi:hypothetical protein
MGIFSHSPPMHSCSREQQLMPQQMAPSVSQLEPKAQPGSEERKGYWMVGVFLVGAAGAALMDVYILHADL